VGRHGLEGHRALYARRGLNATFPQLKEYLAVGQDVLDVGCGPGTITLDVAEAVASGNVCGVDT